MIGRNPYFRKIIANGLLAIFIISFLPNLVLHSHAPIDKEHCEAEVHEHSQIIDNCEDCIAGLDFDPVHKSHFSDQSPTCDLCDFTIKKTYHTSQTATIPNGPIGIDETNNEPQVMYVEGAKTSPFNKGSPLLPLS